MTKRKKDILKQIGILTVELLIIVAYVVFVLFVMGSYNPTIERSEEPMPSQSTAQSLSANNEEGNVSARAVSPFYTVISVPYFSTQQGIVQPATSGTYPYVLILKCESMIVGNQYTVESINRLGETNLCVLAQDSKSYFSTPAIDTFVTFTASSSTCFFYVWYEHFVSFLPVAIDLDFGIYQGEYSPGFLQGYNLGQLNGFAEGSSLAKYGIWYGATVDGEFFYDFETSEKSIVAAGLVPDYTRGGIYFKSILAKYYYHPDDTGTNFPLTSCIITVNFATPFTYDNVEGLNTIFKYGASLVENGEFIASSGKIYDFKFLYNAQIDGASKLELSSISSLNDIVGMRLYFGRANDLLGQITLQSVDTGYYGGYSEGFNAGLKEADRNAYWEGYDEGESKGLQVGYGNGYQAGLEVAQKGSFFSLMTAIVDAPVSVFSSLLNFEILGFNMRSVVLSLLTAALVVCAIRVFSGGKA